MQNSNNYTISEQSGGDHTEDESQDETLEVSNRWEEDTKCGLGQWQPQWLQRLASKKSYILVYGLVGMFDSAVTSYYAAVVSTLEKRFKIPSRTSGLISSAVDIGNLSAVIILTYIGSRNNVVRWLAGGCLVEGFTCLLFLLPHFMYGPGPDALSFTQEYAESYGLSIGNLSAHAEESRGLCRSQYKEEEDCYVGGSSIPSIIFFMASFIFGVCSSLYYTLGIAYVDDNAKKYKTPLLLATLHCIKLFGPTVGYIFGSYALQLYVDPNLHPTINDEDPRWIGAWWFGWAPLGAFIIILSMLLALFPQKLPRVAKRTMLNATEETMKRTRMSFQDEWNPLSFSEQTEYTYAGGYYVIITMLVIYCCCPSSPQGDFKKVLLRLTKNKVLMYNTFSLACFTFGLVGYFTFMPKYIEYQFRQTASRSSLITGSVGLICSGLGVLASGIVITKYKPRARYLAAWNVIVEVVDVIGHLSYGFMTCATEDLHGEMKPDHSWDLSASCNSNCDCGPTVKYSPVCAADGSNTFFSPCHAGCNTFQMINGTKMYGNCSCIGDDGMGWAVEGACPAECTTNFTIYLVLQCILRFTSASGRAGNTIIQFRCVDEKDKSMSFGISAALMSALAFIPGPIVYGMLLDSACIVWGEVCGESGNCWLYDAKKLGFHLNFLSAAFLLVGTLLDVCVWYYVKDLQMYDDEEDDTKKITARKKSKQKEQDQLNQINC